MAAGVAALIITVVALVRWRRTEGENVHRLNFVPGFSLQKLTVTHFVFSGNKTQMEENTVSLHHTNYIPAVECDSWNYTSRAEMKWRDERASHFRTTCY